MREARQPVMYWHAIFWWEIWEFGMSWRDAELLGGVDKSLIYYCLLLLLLLLLLPTKVVGITTMKERQCPLHTARS